MTRYPFKDLNRIGIVIMIILLIYFFYSISTLNPAIKMKKDVELKLLDFCREQGFEDVKVSWSLKVGNNQPVFLCTKNLGEGIILVKVGSWTDSSPYLLKEMWEI